MTMRKIRQWAYSEGKRAVTTIPPGANTKNIRKIILSEWMYLERDWGTSIWWMETVLPTLKENRIIGNDQDWAFENFLIESFNGFSERILELFEDE